MSDEVLEDHYTVTKLRLIQSHTAFEANMEFKMVVSHGQNTATKFTRKSLIMDEIMHANNLLFISETKCENICRRKNKRSALLK